MNYDLIIIGSGPAGITAGIYANRYELKVLILGKEIGGTANKALRAENYPGFNSIPGPELMEKFKGNLDYLKVPYCLDDVEKIEKIAKGFKIFTGNKTYQTKSLILATGTEVKRLDVPGERELTGKGVSYCVTCDGQFFKNKTVAVIGAGDAGAMACLMLSEIAKKIYWIYVEETPLAMPFWLEKLKKINKIEKISQNTLLEIKGINKVEKIILAKKYQGKKEIALDGVFIHIGLSPVANLVKDLGVVLEKGGHLKVDERQETNVAGLFGAGDVTTASYRFKQIITACSEGAISAFGAYQYIKSININNKRIKTN